jgi:hypothetical protein
MADSGWAVVGKVGTVGIGADVHRAIVPHILNLRVGASFFRYSTGFTDKGVDYAGKLKLGAVPVVLDVYPFKNWFRLGGGLFVNLNRVEGTGKPNQQGQITINGRSYPVAQIGQLDGTVKFNRVAPYFGLGFGNPIKQNKHWGFYVDLGAIYHGHPGAMLSTTNTTVPQLQIDLKQQEVRFENDVKGYTFFPIIQFGVSYHF